MIRLYRFNFKRLPEPLSGDENINSRIAALDDDAINIIRSHDKEGSDDKLVTRNLTWCLRILEVSRRNKEYNLWRKRN